MTPQNALPSLVPITVEASTNNPNDQGYHHCFEQNPGGTLTFQVKTDPSIKTIHFVLWKLNDPVNPAIERYMDCPVQDGRAIITVDPPRGHLGPGPYCATLTASSSTALSGTSLSARNIVGETVYYYDTWQESRNCKHSR